MKSAQDCKYTYATKRLRSLVRLIETSLEQAIAQKVQPSVEVLKLLRETLETVERLETAPRVAELRQLRVELKEIDERVKGVQAQVALRRTF